MLRRHPWPFVGACHVLQGEAKAATDKLRVSQQAMVCSRRLKPIAHLVGSSGSAGVLESETHRVLCLDDDMTTSTFRHSG